MFEIYHGGDAPQHFWEAILGDLHCPSTLWLTEETSLGEFQTTNEQLIEISTL